MLANSRPSEVREVRERLNDTNIRVCVCLCVCERGLPLSLNSCTGNREWLYCLLYVLVVKDRVPCISSRTMNAVLDPVNQQTAWPTQPQHATATAASAGDQCWAVGCSVPRMMRIPSS